MFYMNTQLNANSPIAMPTVLCPTCQAENPINVAVCANCGSRLVISGRTTPIHVDHLGEKSNSSITRVTGDASVENNPVHLDIDGVSLTLPDRPHLIFGRSVTQPGVTNPDMPMNEYGADTKGVSRIHCKIRRKDRLLFITDLGSTNGTYLNGRRLIAYEERILRNGDELYLSHLRMVVHFAE